MNDKRKLVETFVLAGICYYNQVPWKFLFAKLGRQTSGHVRRLAIKYRSLSDEEFEQALDRFHGTE